MRQTDGHQTDLIQLAGVIRRLIKLRFIHPSVLFELEVGCDFAIYPEVVVDDEVARFIAFCQRAPDK